MSVVDVERRGSVAIVTLDDSARRNALSTAMVAQISQAVDELEADSAVRALVVTGRGPAFCAGADLGDLAHPSAAVLRDIYEGFLRIARSPLPTIAAVNGAAVGAGMNLALACDVRIVAEDAWFDPRFVKLGIHPGGGHTWMLQRRVGLQATMAMTLLGEVVDGPRAEAIGLAWRSVAAADLLAEAVALGDALAEAPRDLVAAIKATILEMGTVATLDRAVDVEVGRQVWSVEQGWIAERLGHGASGR